MLEDLADAVREDFSESGCPAAVYFGKEYISEHSEAMRVVFLGSAKPDRFDMPLATWAAGYLPQTIADWQQGANPKAFRRRLVTGEAHIWAAAPISNNPGTQRRQDQQALDMLLNQTALSIYRAAMGNVVFNSGRQEQATINVRRGFVYYLEFSLEVPLIDVPWYYPGYIDESSRTWASLPIDQFDVTVQEQEQVTGSIIGSAQFVADGTNPDDQEES
jgi:hypothetical protein